MNATKRIPDPQRFMSHCTRWVGIFLLVILPTSVLAARSAKVSQDSVRMFELPDSTSKVLKTFTSGSSVQASNQPTNHFYKVRTPDHTIGWVAEESLILEDAPGGYGSDDPPLAPPSGAEEAQVTYPLKREPARTKRAVESFGMSIFGGFTFFQIPGVISNFDNVSLGFGYGGSVRFTLSPSVSLVFRGENIYKGVSLTDSSSGKNFVVSFAGIPIMGGLIFNIVSGSVIRIHAEAMAGYAPMTVTSTSVLDSVTPTTQIATGGIAALVGLDLHYHFTQALGLFLEGGYRFIQSGIAVNQAPVGNGGAILNSTFTVNFSGPVANLGISLSL